MRVTLDKQLYEPFIDRNSEKQIDSIFNPKNRLPSISKGKSYEVKPFVNDDEVETLKRAYLSIRKNIQELKGKPKPYLQEDKALRGNLVKSCSNFMNHAQIIRKELTKNTIEEPKDGLSSSKQIVTQLNRLYINVFRLRENILDLEEFSTWKNGDLSKITTKYKNPCAAVSIRLIIPIKVRDPEDNSIVDIPAGSDVTLAYRASLHPVKYIIVYEGKLFTLSLNDTKGQEHAKKIGLKWTKASNVFPEYEELGWETIRNGHHYRNNSLVVALIAVAAANPSLLTRLMVIKGDNVYVKLYKENSETKTFTPTYFSFSNEVVTMKNGNSSSETTMVYEGVVGHGSRKYAWPALFEKAFSLLFYGDELETALLSLISKPKSIQDYITALTGKGLMQQEMHNTYDINEIPLWNTTEVEKAVKINTPLTHISDEIEELFFYKKVIPDLKKKAIAHSATVEKEIRTSCEHWVALLKNNSFSKMVYDKSKSNERISLVDFEKLFKGQQKYQSGELKDKEISEIVFSEDTRTWLMEHITHYFLSAPVPGQYTIWQKELYNTIQNSFFSIAIQAVSHVDTSLEVNYFAIVKAELIKGVKYLRLANSIETTSLELTYFTQRANSVIFMPKG